MIPHHPSKFGSPLAVIMVFAWVLVACVAPQGPLPPLITTPAPAAPVFVTPLPTPSDPWLALLQRKAYPYSRPLPAEQPTALDGVYVKIDPRTTPHVHCLRCPDYVPEGGLWKLQFHNGVFHIYYPATGWRSLGSYAVVGDRVELFNDPNCTDLIGTYAWRLDGGELVLEAIGDDCAIRMRAANLSDMPWQSCQPPNREAAVTDHWSKPVGCDQSTQP